MDHFHLIIVTGMSGAGKSHAVQVLEDIGYFCIDNIPVSYTHLTLPIVHQRRRTGPPRGPHRRYPGR